MSYRGPDSRRPTLAGRPVGGGATPAHGLPPAQPRVHANHLDTPFTYADLPEPNDRVHDAYRNPEPAAGMPDDAEIIRVGSASKHAKSDVIRELNALEITRTVDLETFQLTPKGRDVTMEIGG